jgi:hypothetical protein
MVHVDPLTWFNYHVRRKGFPQLMYYSEKYFQLELMNIQNNSKNFLTNF